MSRLHLLDSDVPFLEGLDTAANCRKVVPQAVAVHTQDWTGGPVAGWLNSLTCCQKCAELSAAANGRLYTYALADGRKIRDVEIREHKG